MSSDGDDQSFHSPGPHSEWPAGHDVPTSVAGEQSQRSELHGPRNPEARALTDLTLAEGATARSNHQTRSKEQAVPVCLGPLDKPIFDERFAVPRGDKQFIKGPKELHESGITPALRHIVRSTQRYGTKSKIHKTSEASVSSLAGSPPYPIRPSIFYPVDDPSIAGQQPSSADPAQSTEHRANRSFTRTRGSELNATLIRTGNAPHKHRKFS